MAQNLAWLDRVATELTKHGCYPYYDSELGWIVGGRYWAENKHSGLQPVGAVQGPKEWYRPTISEAYKAAAERLMQEIDVVLAEKSKAHTRAQRDKRNILGALK